MVDRQFWPSLGYGICNNTASWDKLELCLKRVYWQLLPKGGILQTAPAVLRQMDRGFYDVGCPHPGVKCLVAQITKLLIHYGCRLGIGLEMSVYHGTETVLPATLQIVLEVLHLGHSYLALFPVGEGG
jgi:hypothetical protein